jgi:hypothetical protein
LELAGGREAAPDGGARALDAMRLHIIRGNYLHRI